MIRFIDYSFCYEGMPEESLRNINLDIREGEFVLLTGRSGCGKSTVLRSINGLVPHFYPGRTEGELLFGNSSVTEMNPSELVGKVGTVFQDPRSQFFMTDTTRELAFGCVNMGYKREEIIDRVEKTVTDLELAEYLGRSIFSLSSGEKQQIAIGSVYALSPEVYLFDEPSANLDHEATKRLSGIMKKLKESGVTIIVADHRFYYLRDLIDTVIYIENGQITERYTGEEFRNLDKENRIKRGLRSIYPEKEIMDYRSSQTISEKGNKVFRVEDLSFGYEKKETIFDKLSFEVFSGDVIGVIGHNGAGKTTLISVLTGLLREKSGKVYYDDNKLTHSKRRKMSYLVMQDADYQLFTASVEEELSLGIKDPEKKKMEDTLNRLALSECRERHPAALSGGQKQRVTIGTSLMNDREILCFDEPTSGLDYDSMVRVSELIRELSDNGAVIFLVSHDFEFITHTCTKLFSLDSADGCMMMEVSEENIERYSKEYFN